MSLLDELGKEKLANCNIIMPRKKTGDTVSSYATTVWNLLVEHKVLLETLRDYCNNHNNKLNPDALPYSTISKQMLTLSSLIIKIV